MRVLVRSARAGELEEARRFRADTFDGIGKLPPLPGIPLMS